jgi:Uma2 family endonuclease
MVPGRDAGDRFVAFFCFRYSGSEMAAHPIAAPMTAEQFLRAYGDDDDNFRRYELIDGEVDPRSVPGTPHDVVKNNLKELFDRSGVDRALFRCWIEHGFVMSGGRMADSGVLTPDVAIARTGRLLGHEGFTPGALEIAMEVALHDGPGVLQGHAWRELTEADTLEFPELLPGLSIPVAAVFEGVAG